ncbi:hypothetical protein J5N97_018522 [Dioscorea zingiberensis]|uniref:Uncharacterized protein n=1 Tax=Dioscorea zingiberensis TaxID=325984 RepID=A0A9D5HBY3_9LILI|nr:hypothetical protein J5N97_018522 [Dioscorea zingiberensis]
MAERRAGLYDPMLVLFPLSNRSRGSSGASSPAHDLFFKPSSTMVFDTDSKPTQFATASSCSATATATWPGLNRANRSSRFPTTIEAEELSIRLERKSSLSLRGGGTEHPAREMEFTCPPVNSFNKTQKDFLKLNCLKCERKYRRAYCQGTTHNEDYCHGSWLLLKTCHQ